MAEAYRSKGGAPSVLRRLGLPLGRKSRSL
jgi:hypothetical protein